MALKQKGYKDACKIPGCELWLKIITRFYKEKTFYLVGGKPQIVNETVEKLCSEYQDIRIVGYRNGYIKTDEEEILWRRNRMWYSWLWGRQSRNC